MQRLLKQTTTGHIFVWTENLASRPDMVPFEREIPSENRQEASAETPPQERPTLQDAVESFRRQVAKAPKRGLKTSAGDT